MELEQNIALVCWLLFVVYWVINIPLQKKTAIKFGVKGQFKYRFLSAFAGILLVVPIIVMLNSPAVYFSHYAFVADISIIFSVLGVGFAIWARRNLAGNWSQTLDFKEQHKLVTSGPYKFVRHPMYTGMLLMYAGIALAFLSWVGLLGVLFLFWAFLERIKSEEALMAEHFPNEYPGYKKETKKLIPFIF